MPITHAIYLVSNTEKAVEFLGRTFDFSIQADEITITGDRFLTMGETGGDGLHLQIINTEEQPAIAELKLKAGTVDFIFETSDIKKMMDRVKRQGLKIHRQPIKAEYGWTAIFEDPFGNLWDLIQRN